MILNKLSNFFNILFKFNFKLYIQIFITILKQDYYKYPKYVSNFEKSLAREFGVKYCLTFASGSAAFYASILSLNLEKGSKVLISSLTFPTVIEILKKFEFDIHYFDIDKKFQAIQCKIKPPKYDYDFDLLVMTYPFGFYINYEPLKYYLKKNAKIVLDLSHSQGIKINSINPIKSSNLAFMSMQGNKSISGGEGGVVLTDNEILYSKMINNHHPGHLLNKNKNIAGAINDIKLRMHPISALLANNSLNSFKKRNLLLKRKIIFIYDLLSQLGVNHPFSNSTSISGFHYGIPFFSKKKINSEIIKNYNWYVNFDKVGIKKLTEEHNDMFFEELYFIDLEWVKNNNISIIKKKIKNIFTNAYRS